VTDPRERLIVALDQPTLAEALALVDELGDSVLRYKVGLELYLSEGRAAIDALVKRDKRIFLDLKLHDIPETVRRAARAVVGQGGVDLLTVHASGGRAMLEAAVDGAKGARVLAVTVLTSLGAEDLLADGHDANVENLVVRRAEIAVAAGCAGAITSPLELPALRRAVPWKFQLVTPGIRPAGGATGDQKRTATAASARAAGADAVVVGRPIRDGADPAARAAVVAALIAELH
jgi:orotidine-5'-phosphate decarboxylase